MVSSENNPSIESQTGQVEQELPESQEDPEKKEKWSLKDIKGFIHIHSWEGSSCAKDTLERIKTAVQNKTGLEYIGMSEHVGFPGEEYWFEKIKKEFIDIDKINEEGSRPKVFKGVEVNVSSDGAIDAPDDILDQAEIVVASIHYKNTDKPEEMTAQNTVDRWVKVMDSYSEVNVLGHPLRDLPMEEWPKMDWDTLCAKAKEKNIAIELSISDSAPAELPKSFFIALRKHDNLVVIAPDFHNLSSYLEKDGDLPGEQKKLLDEYYKLKGDIAGITFKNGEEVKGRGLNKPEYSDEEKKEKIERLQKLRLRLSEIEESEDLAKIYEILSSNIKYSQDENENVTAEKKPLAYQMLRKYATRMHQLRRPIDDTGLPAISKNNIVNLWDTERFANWIKSRKEISVIEKRIEDVKD